MVGHTAHPHLVIETMHYLVLGLKPRGTVATSAYYLRGLAIRCGQRKIHCLPGGSRGAVKAYNLLIAGRQIISERRMAGLRQA